MTAVSDFALSGAKNALDIAIEFPVFSIGTLVTDSTQYQRMLQSFERNGFSAPYAEFLYVDNRLHNRLDAYAGLNYILARSSGRFVILCHQDIELIVEGREQLATKLGELSKLDPSWAVAGNAGWGMGGPARRISDPHGENQLVGRLPAPVDSLDENFLVVRREAMLWVIDFHIRHYSKGNLTRPFYNCLSNFERKYSRLRGSRLIRTSCKQVLLGGSPVRTLVRRLRRSERLRAMTKSVPLLRRLYTADYRD